MAAVQIGIPKRLLYVKSKSTDKKLANEKDQILMINPVIISQKGRTEFLESCESCKGLTGLVERPYEIIVKYQNIKGEYTTERFEGFVSTILSHEIDHMDGILHMDRAKKVFKMPPAERDEYRKTHPYKIISKDCNFNYKPICKNK